MQISTIEVSGPSEVVERKSREEGCWKEAPRRATTDAATAALEEDAVKARTPAESMMIAARRVADVEKRNLCMGNQSR